MNEFEIWGFFEVFYNWFKYMFNDLSVIGQVLSFQINFGNYTFSLFTLLTVSGLLAFLTVAIIKWVLL